MNQADAVSAGVSIGTSAGHWFVRGLVSGVLLVAALNGVSYFFRTASIVDLIGPENQVDESLGFPWLIWEETQSYGALFVDYAGIGWNLMVGAIVGSLLGCLAIGLRTRLNRWVAEFESRERARSKLGFRFSVGGLMWLTGVAALLLALMTSWYGTVEAMLGIYFAGPFTMIAIAMLPRNVPWQIRVVVVSILSLTMIAVAVLGGMQLGIPLDRVMLGIFVFWTPQTTLTAAGLTLFLMGQLWWNSESSDSAPAAS